MSKLTAEFIRDLATKIRPTFPNGRYREAEISARKRAKIRKEALLAGLEWPHDAPRRPEKPWMKGHKHEREAAARQGRIAELMEKMPQILADWRKRKAEQKLGKKKE